MNDAANRDVWQRSDVAREMAMHFRERDEADGRDFRVEWAVVGMFAVFAMVYVAIALGRMSGLMP